MEACEESKQVKISGPMLIVLHLAPGLIFGGVFFVLSSKFIASGLTGYLALLVTIPICLVPIEIGVMRFWSVRETGRTSVSTAILYRQRGTLVDYIVWPLLLFICWGILSITIAPIALFLDANVSGWIPAWATQESLLNNLLASPPNQRPVTLGLAVLLSGVVAPLIEEAYFRGFLLPRMAHWGWAAPVVNALLFAIYHFYFPGNVPGIFAAFVPTAFIVMIKKNWRIGLVFHSAVNLWGVYSVATAIT